MSQDEVNYSGHDVSNGDEHNHDRRHHHHHHHHNNHHHGHHQLQNKYMNSKSDNQSNINHVILITVINPYYPITCDLIHQICSNYGKVNRIVIFKKNGVQAMVEFDNIESAKRARAMLHGCDIYSGCCTLKIEFAKPSRLNVHKNDSESFDYTNPNLGTGPPSQLQTTPESSLNDNHHQQQHHHHHHLQQTSSGNQHASYSHGMNPHHHRGPVGIDRRGANLSGLGGDVNNAQSSTGGHNHHHHASQFHHSPHMHQPLSSHHQHSKQSIPPHALSGPAHQGTVLMVYGLSVDRINCDRLFNLFCLYGNVVRIKFLRTKEGCAMVQMGDILAVDRCFSSLNKTILFGNELQISYSKQAFLHDVMQPFTLPDGSPSFKDFMGNKNNRFRNPEVASKNRILPPSPVLHFFNAPFGISDDELLVLFKQTTSYEPVSLKIFPPKVDNAKSFSGLVTFRDPAEATEALVLCNHLSIPKVGVPHPYILRLCFSPPTYC